MSFKDTIRGRNKIIEYKKIYNNNGFLSPIKIISNREALNHRKELEGIEKKIGSVHNINKIHTILTSTFALACNSNILNIVEAILGSNVLLYNATYLIKEPNDSTFVSWHQDLTYWGFSNDQVVSVWLSFTDTNEHSGGMKMIPGSHKKGRLNHKTTTNVNNMLIRGQTVENINENQAVSCPLFPGEASFHHGWTLHASMANKSIDRRIGLNIQYIATNVKQTKHDFDSAVCILGNDKFKNFANEIPAKIDLDPKAMLKQKKLEKHLRSITKTK